MQTVLDSLGAVEVLRRVGADASEAFVAMLSPLDLIVAIQQPWCDAETAGAFSRSLRGTRKVQFSVYLDTIDQWYKGGPGTSPASQKYTLAYLLELMMDCATTTSDWLHCAQVSADLGEPYLHQKNTCLDNAVVAATSVDDLIDLFVWGDEVVDAQRRRDASALLKRRQDPPRVWVEALRDNAASASVCTLILSKLTNAEGLILSDWICVLDACRDRRPQVYSQLTELAQGRIHSIVTSLCASNDKGEEEEG